MSLTGRNALEQLKSQLLARKRVIHQQLGTYTTAKLCSCSRSFRFGSLVECSRLWQASVDVLELVFFLVFLQRSLDIG